MKLALAHDAIKHYPLNEYIDYDYHFKTVFYDSKVRYDKGLRIRLDYMLYDGNDNLIHESVNDHCYLIHTFMSNIRKTGLEFKFDDSTVNIFNEIDRIITDFDIRKNLESFADTFGALFNEKVVKERDTKKSICMTYQFGKEINNG